MSGQDEKTPVRSGTGVFFIFKLLHAVGCEVTPQRTDKAQRASVASMAVSRDSASETEGTDDTISECLGAAD